MAEIEHISMKLAELQKIPVANAPTSPVALIASEKKYHASCERLGKIVDKYSDQAPDDKLTLFQMLLFSFWIGNADMHLKNFSLWRDPRR